MPPPPSLEEAFAALLAAEQRIGLAPSAAAIPPPPAPAPAAPSEDLIEDVCSRVLSRLTDQNMRLAQRLALMEERVLTVERQGDTDSIHRDAV